LLIAAQCPSQPVTSRRQHGMTSVIRRYRFTASANVVSHPDILGPTAERDHFASGRQCCDRRWSAGELADPCKVRE
jgi:hypothetical protein